VGFEACKLPGYLRLSCGHRKKYGSVLEVSRCLPTVYLFQTPVAYVNELKILVANQNYHVVVTNRHVTNKKSLEDRVGGRGEAFLSRDVCIRSYN